MGAPNLASTWVTGRLIWAHNARDIVDDSIHGLSNEVETPNEKVATHVQDRAAAHSPELRAGWRSCGADHALQLGVGSVGLPTRRWHAATTIPLRRHPKGLQ